ncbi:MAG: hypothetical protein ACREBU_25480, partial [Nitrososphaera sp.]
QDLVIYAVSLFAALSLTMLFHVYTWGYVMLVIVLFTCFSYVALRKSHSTSRGSNLKVAAILVFVIIASVVTDYAKSSYFGISSGLSNDSLLAGRTLNLENFNNRWSTLDFTLRTYVGGFLSNPIIIMLALFCAFKLDYFGGFQRLIFSMLIVLIIPLLLGNTVIQARMLYAIPLYIPAALVLLQTRKANDTTPKVLVIAFMLSLAVYSVRAMANLPLVVPGDIELEDPFLIP